MRKYALMKQLIFRKNVQSGENIHKIWRKKPKQWKKVKKMEENINTKNSGKTGTLYLRNCMMPISVLIYMGQKSGISWNTLCKDKLLVGWVLK
jgi:hypothetical protein